ncbi:MULTISPECIES: hypothetical protein [unclassified Roseburia]|uniref:hypothetical protein n=1 Tax=unclassified Roseburia TaxID=2637578 RepID=UPI000E4762F6|nr:MULTISPECIES: hypothetical protein [unclassified Roseburia]RHQ37419.1 hypothetical protein DWY49_14965 [Roseburia sp. AF25-25LB]RHQ39859.1 hypothetical protein DWY43_14565 [Roseburia sp. AF25-18LB]RHQ47150.1 hypothetical protein DWY39_10860 [Roseburia sp. AF25-15LB]RHQ47405.1 hypothetical protein DWY37_11790 [Roseburia sp. AF25-13LB]
MYDEFEALSKKEQLEYINRIAAWVLSIIPEVELEDGLYEVTVPLGVDMTATYCVSVKGTTNFGNQSTINFAIEKQQTMLQSFKISSEYLFDNKLSVAGELSEDGEASVSIIATEGNMEVSLGHGISPGTSSVKYEIEKTLEDNVKVASSIEVKKANNTEMPEWEAIPITVKETAMERNPIPEHEYQIDGEKVRDLAIVLGIAYGLYFLTKWAVAVVFMAPTGGASIMGALVAP